VNLRHGVQAIALVAVLSAAPPVDAAPAERERARELVERRDFAPAIALFDAMLAAHPGDSDLAIERARVLGYADRNREAADAYAAVASSFPARRADVLPSWAWQRLWSGDPAGAEPLFREALDSKPNDAAARLGLGQCLLWSGREQQALVEFDRVLAQDPASREARLGRATALNFSGRAREASREYSKMLPTDDGGLALQAARARYWAGFPEQAMPLLATATTPEAQWLRDYRIHRELRTYVSSSFDWSDDADDLSVVSLSMTGGWRHAARDTIEASMRTTRLEGPDTTLPGAPRSSVDGQEAMAAWSARRGSLDSTRGVVWPMLSVGVRDYDGWTTFAWRARVRYSPLDQVFLTAYAGNGVLETIGALRNRVGHVEGALSAEVRSVPRWTFAGGFTRLGYDDDNDRDQWNARAEYLLLPQQRLRIGADVLAFDNRNPTGPTRLDHGYWNPDRYTQERLYVSISGDRGRWSYDARASGGLFQESDGWGNDTHDPTFAFEGATAYDFSPSLQLRCYAGGSRSGAGLVSGGDGYHRTYAGASLTGYF
jgi:tetratricopeptide (TPR) repeat protein